MAQHLAVAVIVALAALYVGARHLPARWRRRLIHRLSRGGRGPKLARWLDTGAGCGSGCNSCNTCAEPAAPPQGKHRDGGRRVIKLRQQR